MAEEAVEFAAVAPVKFAIERLIRDARKVALPMLLGATVLNLDALLAAIGVESPGEPAAAAAWWGAWLVLGAYLRAGLTAFALRVARGEPASPKLLFSGLGRVPTLVVLELLFFTAAALAWVPLFIALNDGGSATLPPPFGNWASPVLLDSRPTPMLRTSLVVASVGIAGMLLVAWLGFSVATAAVVAEGAGPFKALQRSWQLTRGFKARIA